MTQRGFLIDQGRCIGCHACTVACKVEHGVELGVFRTWVKYVERGEFRHTRRHFAVLRCNHCTHAPCVTACPVTALFRRDDGIVDLGADSAALDPLAAGSGGAYLTVELTQAQREKLAPLTDAPAVATMDVDHPAPWGWRVSSYFLTKGSRPGR
jgi:ferredoxin